MKVHAARGDQRRCGRNAAEGQRRGRHGHRVRVVGLHDIRPEFPQDSGQPPRRGEIDFVVRGEPDQIDAFGGARQQLSLRIRDEQGPMPALAQPQHRQERLLLSAAPGAGRVDVEAEHSSQSLASLRPT